MRKIMLMLLLMVLLVNLTYVSAITGSIGNARMILNAEQGDTIEKSVLVKNVNDVAVDIEISASGDLADYVDIQDEKFTLQAGEEKKAYFTIEVKEAGTTETKISVLFVPTEGGNGVGLSSTIIITAEKSSWFDWGSDSNTEEDCVGDSCDVDENTTTITTGNNSGSGISAGVIVAVLTTGIVFIALVFLLVLLLKKSKNKKKMRERGNKLRKRSGNR